MQVDKEGDEAQLTERIKHALANVTERSIDELSETCKALQLSTKGQRSQLLQRIENHLALIQARRLVADRVTMSSLIEDYQARAARDVAVVIRELRLLGDLNVNLNPLTINPYSNLSHETNF